MADYILEECPECHGAGEIETEYEDMSGHVHAVSFDCPVCDGVGEIELEDE